MDLRDHRPLSTGLLAKKAFHLFKPLEKTKQEILVGKSMFVDLTFLPPSPYPLKWGDGWVGEMNWSRVLGDLFNKSMIHFIFLMIWMDKEWF